jgi:hypothetical protein
MFVTTLSTELLNEYGRQTVATWSAFTQRRIVVVVGPGEVAAFREVLNDSYEVVSFSGSSLAAMAAIRQRENELNYRRGDYRYQAARFSWKVFALADAFGAFPNEPAITWLDADSLLRPGIDTWLQQIFSSTHGVSFLGRAHKQLHVESGLMNFLGDDGRGLYRRVIDTYRTLDLFNFKEWHDGFIVTPFFQFSKYGFDISKQHRVRSSNPLFEIDRGRHLLHLKGARKASSSLLLDNLRVWLGR